MNDELLISICVLTYNRSEHLKRILSFLRNELYNLDNKSEVELIISDNCSTDDTPAVIKEFVTNIDNGYNIRVQRNEENLGLLGNLLRTAEISSGKYHWWWGDDDYYKEGIISRVISECKKNPSHIFVNYSAFLVHPGDNKGLPSALDVIDMNCERPLYELLLSNPGHLMFISANIYRNDLIKEILISKVEKNLSFPLYCSLKCMIHGQSAIIEDVMIDDNYRDISWGNSSIKKRVILYYIPYYISLMPKLGYDKEFSKNVWKHHCSGLWYKRLRSKLDYYYKKLF